jgi:hypothetical protein
MLELKTGRYQMNYKMIVFEEVLTPDEIHGIPTPKKSRLT